jgi:hypothetical protein
VRVLVPDLIDHVDAEIQVDRFIAQNVLILLCDLLRQKAGLRRLRAQAKMLPQHARAQDRALPSRSRSRQGARNRKDRGLRRFTPGAKEG